MQPGLYKIIYDEKELRDHIDFFEEYERKKVAARDILPSYFYLLGYDVEDGEKMTVLFWVKPTSNGYAMVQREDIWGYHLPAPFEEPVQDFDITTIQPKNFESPEIDESGFEEEELKDEKYMEEQRADKLDYHNRGLPPRYTVERMGGLDTLCSEMLGWMDYIKNYGNGEGEKGKIVRAYLE